MRVDDRSGRCLLPRMGRGSSFFGMSSSSALRLELLEQHRRVVADARVRERGELVRIGAAEERVHPFPHPCAARDAQLERGPAQHLVYASGVCSAGQLREGAADALLG